MASRGRDTGQSNGDGGARGNGAPASGEAQAGAAAAATGAAASAAAAAAQTGDPADDDQVWEDPFSCPFIDVYPSSADTTGEPDPANTLSSEEVARMRGRRGRPKQGSAARKKQVHPFLFFCRRCRRLGHKTTPQCWLKSLPAVRYHLKKDVCGTARWRAQASAAAAPSAPPARRKRPRRAADAAAAAAATQEAEAEADSAPGEGDVAADPSSAGSVLRQTLHAGAPMDRRRAAAAADGTQQPAPCSYVESAAVLATPPQPDGGTLPRWRRPAASVPCLPPADAHALREHARDAGLRLRVPAPGGGEREVNALCAAGEEVVGRATLHAGLTVRSLAWAPVRSGDHRQPAFLAVGTQAEPGEACPLARQPGRRAALQLWSVEAAPEGTAPRPARACLAALLAHDHGPCVTCAWEPLTAPDSRSAAASAGAVAASRAPKQSRRRARPRSGPAGAAQAGGGLSPSLDASHRLGLLAAAFIDGTVGVYAVPTPPPADTGDGGSSEAPPLPNAWSLDAFSLLEHHIPAPDAPHTLAWHPSVPGRLAVSSADGEVRVWDLAHRNVEGAALPLQGAAARPDVHLPSREVAFDVKGRMSLRRTVTALCWCPDDPGVLASGSRSGVLSLWDVRRRTAVSYTSPSNAVSAIVAIAWRRRAGNLLLALQRGVLLDLPLFGLVHSVALVAYAPPGIRAAAAGLAGGRMALLPNAGAVTSVHVPAVAANVAWRRMPPRALDPRVEATWQRTAPAEPDGELQPQDLLAAGSRGIDVVVDPPGDTMPPAELLRLKGRPRAQGRVQDAKQGFMQAARAGTAVAWQDHRHWLATALPGGGVVITVAADS